MNLQCYRKVWWATTVRALRLNYNNDNFHVNCNNNLNNNGYAAPMTLADEKDILIMKTTKNLYSQLCSYENLLLAFLKARKRKTTRPYVLEFEKKLEENLNLLREEILSHSYHPLPLKTFILHDPKTRKISVSDFRDRIVHHAICNIISPIFESRFIYDSYANRTGKGIHSAIYRLFSFQRKVSGNGIKSSISLYHSLKGYFLKGDIRHYFDNVSHEKLLEILKVIIKDQHLIGLIGLILKNHHSKLKGRGMPLGNLTSQFFANVYLNELDQYIKHQLKAKYYIRYVDDFVILHRDKNVLESFKEKINAFLKKELLIELHMEKSKIKPLSCGIDFIGFRNFYKHRLLRKRNVRKVYSKLKELRKDYSLGLVDYDKIDEVLCGWLAYAKTANTHKLRSKIISLFEQSFPGEVSSREINQWIKDQEAFKQGGYLGFNYFSTSRRPRKAFDS